MISGCGVPALDMRLPKSLRLTRWCDYARVRKEGRTVAGRYLVLGVAPHGGQKEFRVGFVTSKKVGNAVMRNLVRRRLRAVVREFGERVQGEVDLVTVARFRAGSATYGQLRSEWARLARKAGVLNESEVVG